MHQKRTQPQAAGLEGLGRDRVEHLAGLIVAGDLLEVEETQGVVMTPRLLHRLLIRQKGGRLGEEDREGAQTKVGHRITCLPVSESLECIELLGCWTS